MLDLWISLEGIPADGREMSFSDQTLWTGPARELKVPVTFSRPMEAEIKVQPQGDTGCLVQGRLAGCAVMPCDRCAEDFEFEIEQSFEQYEDVEDEDNESPVLRNQGSGLELNVAALVWERFVMALPVKPLCDDQCKGLCPECGANLNQGSCDCGGEQGDPRMAALRNLKIDK